MRPIGRVSFSLATSAAGFRRRVGRGLGLTRVGDLQSEYDPPPPKKWVRELKVYIRG